MTESSIAAMPRFIRFVLALALAAAVVPTVSAHSLKDLESMLGDKEKYFQPMDKEVPSFALQDAEGRTVALSAFRNKVVVLHFIYTNCPDVCPLHAERIAEIQRMVNQTPMKEQVQFVTITTDPKNDTPEVLRDYGQAHGLDPVNWVFLTAGQDQPDDTTRRLAEAYGLKFTKTDDGYQMHAVVTHVIDQDGRLRARFHGLKFAPVNAVLFVNALVNKAQKPPWSRRARPLGKDERRVPMTTWFSDLAREESAAPFSPSISVSRITWPVVLRRYIGFVAVTNLVWEIVQLPLYTIWVEGNLGEIAFAVIHCTGGDILIAGASLMGPLLLLGNERWPDERYARVAAFAVIVGLAYTVASEWLNTEIRGSWAYSDLMPVLPWIGSGFAPLAQWIVIPATGFWWASRSRNGSASSIRAKRGSS